MSNRICVFLAPGYEEVEALTPVDFLRRAGLTVDIVSTVEDITVESSHQVNVQADTFLEDINPDDYALVVIPGGLPGAPNLANNPEVIDFIQKMNAAGKDIAAICAGPIVLEKAGLLKGRRATCFPGVEEKLTSASECLTDTVVVDGNIITARGAGASGYLGLTLVERLAGKEAAEKVRTGTVMDIVEANLKK